MPRLAAPEVRVATGERTHDLGPPPAGPESRYPPTRSTLGSTLRGMAPDPEPTVPGSNDPESAFPLDRFTAGDHVDPVDAPDALTAVGAAGANPTAAEFAAVLADNAALHATVTDLVDALNSVVASLEGQNLLEPAP